MHTISAAYIVCPSCLSAACEAEGLLPASDGIPHTDRCTKTEAGNAGHIVTRYPYACTHSSTRHAAFESRMSFASDSQHPHETITKCLCLQYLLETIKHCVPFLLVGRLRSRRPVASDGHPKHRPMHKHRSRPGRPHYHSLPLNVHSQLNLRPDRGFCQSHDLLFELFLGHWRRPLRHQRLHHCIGRRRPRSHTRGR